MKHYSRLAKKVIRRYKRSKILMNNFNPRLEYRLLRSSFKRCKYCYLRNKEKYGKCRAKVLRELVRKYRRH